MNKFLLALVALVVLLAAILVVAPGLIPVSTYKPRLEAAASSALGRQVTIGDGLRLKIVPQTAFHVEELVVANADGFSAPYLARVKSADIGVKLFPLLSGAVEVERFVLTEPEINLAVAADGRVNWNLAAAGAEPAAEPGAAPEIRDIKLGDVRLVDGRATYTDEAAGKTFTAEDIDVAARLTSLSEPLEVEGTMLFEGAPTTIDLVLTTLEDILKQEPANLKLDLALGATSAGADITVEMKDGLSYAGPVKFSAPDLPAFAALAGAPLADAPGFDALSVEGEARGTDGGVALAGAAIQFDKIDATGDLALDWTGARPKATGQLAAGSLDLRPYLPPPATEPASGFPQWSEEKLDLASLRNIDADIDVTAEKIFLNDMEIGESRMKLTVDDGRMVADIPALGLYGGGGSGRLVVNARGAEPTFSGVFDVGAVQAEPFTTDLMKIDRLLGLGGFNFEFAAQGASQAAIMRSLDGKGGFDLADGAIKGVNLAKLARAIDEVRKGGLNPTAITSAIAAAQAPNEQTDFSEFLSAFTITDGVVNAPTISLTGPFLTMAGTGDVNLPAQTLDLRLAPKAMTTIDGEGGQAFAIPMRVSGTFSQPKISIDAEALLRGRAEQTITDFLGKAIGGRKDGAATEGAQPGVRGALEGVLGTRPQPAAAEGAAEPAPSVEEAIAGEALNTLFGRKKKAEEPPAEEDPQP